MNYTVINQSKNELQASGDPSHAQFPFLHSVADLHPQDMSFIMSSGADATFFGMSIGCFILSLVSLLQPLENAIITNIVSLREPSLNNYFLFHFISFQSLYCFRFGAFILFVWLGEYDC